MHIKVWELLNILIWKWIHDFSLLSFTFPLTVLSIQKGQLNMTWKLSTAMKVDIKVELGKSPDGSFCWINHLGFSDWNLHLKWINFKFKNIIKSFPPHISISQVEYVNSFSFLILETLAILFLSVNTWEGKWSMKQIIKRLKWTLTLFVLHYENPV